MTQNCSIRPNYDAIFSNSPRKLFYVRKSLIIVYDTKYDDNLKDIAYICSTVMHGYLKVKFGTKNNISLSVPQTTCFDSTSKELTGSLS